MKIVGQIVTISLLCLLQDTLFGQAKINEPQLSAADQVAFRLIGGMEGALNGYKNIIKEQSSPQNNIKLNGFKNIFRETLDSYLAQFGQVEEKQSGLFNGYRMVHAISAKDDTTQPITPNQHAILLELLQIAATTDDWGKTINLELSVIKNGMFKKENLTLDQIIAAIKQIPVSSNYSISSMATYALAATAIATGAYLAYNAFKTPTQPVTKPAQKMPEVRSIKKEPVQKEIKTTHQAAEPQVVATSAAQVMEAEQIENHDFHNEDNHDHLNDGKVSSAIIKGIHSGFNKIGDALNNNIKVPASWIANNNDNSDELQDYLEKATNNPNHTSPLVQAAQPIATMATNLYHKTDKLPAPKGLQSYMKNIPADNEEVMGWSDDSQVINQLEKKATRRVHKLNPNGPQSLQYYMKHHGNSITAFDHSSASENYIKPSDYEYYLSNKANEFTVGALEHVGKTIVDLPGEVAELSIDLTHHIMNPTDNDLQRVSDYFDSLQYQTPEEQENSISQKAGMGLLEVDKQIGEKLLTTAAGVTLAPMIFKQAGKFLVTNRLDSLRSAALKTGNTTTGAIAPTKDVIEKKVIEYIGAENRALIKEGVHTLEKPAGRLFIASVIPPAMNMGIQTEDAFTDNPTQTPTTPTISSEQVAAGAVLATQQFNKPAAPTPMPKIPTIPHR